MENDSYGVYSAYFSIVRNFGAFPYSLDSNGRHLSVVKSGLFYWLYIINFTAGTYHAFFQLFQLFFVFMEGASKVVIIGQLSWFLLACLPIANYMKSLGEEAHFGAVVNEWCLLERKIIGSEFRDVRSFAKNGPSPTMSTCHFKQRSKFVFTSNYYIMIGIVGALAVGFHAYFSPTNNAYLSSLVEDGSDLFRNISVGFQLWMYAIIWSNVYALEVLATTISSSVGHVLETLSYKGGVVMTRWTCDHIKVLDLISSGSTIDQNDNEEDDELDKNTAAILEKANRANRKSSAFFQGPEEALFPKTEMSKIIQNLVDIEYGLEGYLRVESFVESFNHSFGRMIPGHQFAYLIMLTIQGLNVIQNFSKMDSGGVAIYLILILLFFLRMLSFFPAMGNLDHRSDSFIDSWMEGLRYIPKGKQTYEFYWYRLKSCKLLDFTCGRYYKMERHTCLEFLFRVSEFVIVLMQITY